MLAALHLCRYKCPSPHPEVAGSDFSGYATRQTRTCSTTQMRDWRRAVERFSFDGTTVRSEGNYQRGELDCEEITDSDGRVTLTFTDVLGRTVLVRRLLDNYSCADTYTIFDSWGNPRVVMPPEAMAGVRGRECAIDEGALQKYAYVYTYDAAMRLRSYRMPGCDPTEYAYDCGGRLLFSRDGNQRRQGKRTFTLRDALGRDAVKGICDDALSDDIWESDLSDLTPALTVGRTSGPGPGFLGTGYTLGEGHLTGAQLLSATFYDAATGRQSGSMEAVLGENGGEATGSTAHLLTSLSYDAAGYPAESRRIYPDGSVLETVTVNSGSGLPLQQTQRLERPDSTVLSFTLTNSYDPHGRHMATDLTLPEGACRELYRAEIGATGEISRELIAGMERLTHRNIRGSVVSWQTPFMSQRLLYGEQGRWLSFTGRVTGKITALTDGPERRYDYCYNHLGFLTEANYSTTDGTQTDFSTSYTYDLQGNPTEITRHSQLPGSRVAVTTTEMTYNGNQLIGQQEFGELIPQESIINDPKLDVGATLLPPLGRQCAYDACGNLTYDPIREIKTIRYNAVNRPQRVVKQAGDTAFYTYTATGAKLGERIVSRDGLSDITRRWYGPFSMVDGALDRIAIPQGYIAADSAIHIYIPDYQGNILGVVNADTWQLIQFTDYYPYGAPHPDAVGAEENRRKFGGKELLTELGLNEYDQEARRHIPARCAFSQPDPLAGSLTDPQTGDKLSMPYNVPVSPYAFCNADPINLTDPSGMDIYKIDEKGNLVERIYTTEYDEFVCVDAKGNARTYENGRPMSVRFKYGTVKKHETRYTHGGVKYDVYMVTGDDVGHILFEFFANNISTVSPYVEFSWVKMSSSTDVKKNTNYLFTSHEAHAESGFMAYMRAELHRYSRVRAHYHVHGTNPAIADNDISAFDIFEQTYGYKVPAYIYFPGNKKVPRHYKKYYPRK